MRLRNPWKMSKKENLNLPLPRLEIRKTLAKKPDHMFNVKAEYGLVYEHLLGDIIFVPFGTTKIGAPDRYDFMDLPFRNGAHILHDMFMLKLRGFVVYQDKYEEIFLTKENMPGGLAIKLKKNTHEQNEQKQES